MLIFIDVAGYLEEVGAERHELGHHDVEAKVELLAPDQVRV